MKTREEQLKEYIKSKVDINDDIFKGFFDSQDFKRVMIGAKWADANPDYERIISHITCMIKEISKRNISADFIDGYCNGLLHLKDTLRYIGIYGEDDNIRLKEGDEEIIMNNVERQFVDLCLPSGRLWATTNEDGFFTYDEAVVAFKDNLPSKEDFEELANNCDWLWSVKRKGYYVIGNNGNFIFFPAAGYRNIYDGSADYIGTDGRYWSSTHGSAVGAYALYFSSSYLGPQNYGDRAYGFSVRCVQKAK